MPPMLLRLLHASVPNPVTTVTYYDILLSYYYRYSSTSNAGKKHAGHRAGSAACVPLAA